jgi:predicted HNH restriction endonuclease
MLIFFSQFSPLKWINGKLVLDVAREEPQAREALIRLATPLIREQQTDRAAELLRVASVKVTDPLNEILNFLPAEQEEETLTLFREGRRVMAYHNRIERSQNLRRLFMRSKYFRKNCDMCVEDLKVKYPWTDRLFEVHHILPLASPLWLSSKGVSLEDVRGICPNCHRGVHRFYVKYLTGKKQPDFSNHEEARDVYTLAKTRVNRFKPA